MITTAPVWPLFEQSVGMNNELRNLMLAEAATALFKGEKNVARGLLHTVVRGAFSYDAVATASGLPRQRVVRALRRSEPVTTATVLVLLTAASKLACISFSVQVTPKGSVVAAEAAE